MKKNYVLLALTALAIASCSSGDDNEMMSAHAGPQMYIQIYDSQISADGDSTQYLLYCGGLKPCDYYPVDFREYSGITTLDYKEAKLAGTLEDLGEPIVYQGELSGELSDNIFRVAGPWFSFEVTEEPELVYETKEGCPVPWLSQIYYLMHVNIAPNTTSHKRLLVFDLKNNGNGNHFWRPEYFIEQDAAEKDDE